MATPTIQVPAFIMDLNTRFDALANKTCECILQSSSTTNSLGRFVAPLLASLNNNRPHFKTAVKVGFVVVGALAVHATLIHPYLVLASVLAGSVVNPKDQTKTALMEWLSDAKVKVIQPILDNETPIEFIAMGILAGTVALVAATTIAISTATGVIFGMQLRQYLTQKSTL